MNPYYPNSEPNFWLSCILMEKGCEVHPLTIMEALAKEGIESRPIWKPMHMQPVFTGYDFITAADTPVSEAVFTRGLCLPSDIKMTEDEQDYVIETIRAAF